MFPIALGNRSLELGRPGPSRQWLNALVLQGLKRATAGLLSEYEDEGEPMEHAGERLTLLDDDRRPIAIIEVDRAERCAFGEVPWAFAAAENEGDRDIEEWRAGHRRFWAAEGKEPTDQTPVVLVWFHLVEVLPASSATG